MKQRSKIARLQARIEDWAFKLSKLLPVNSTKKPGSLKKR